MQQEEFHNLLEKSIFLTIEETNRLKQLVEHFPYFHAARALRLKGLKQNNSFFYNAELKKTAAHTLDRGVLFEYITSKTFQQDYIAEEIKQRVETEENNSSAEEEQSHELPMNLEEANKVLDPALFNRPTSEKQTDNLQVGKPLEFNSSESHSFTEWLKLTKAKPVERENLETKNATEENSAEENSRKFQLIDEFISKNPKIKPSKENLPSSQKPIAQDSPSNQLMTETLARVYLEQKNYSKAIQAFKILILKNPEKSGLFADQIRAIEKIQENKNI